MYPNHNDVKQYFLKLNRTLTACLIIILLLASVYFWYTGSLSLQSSSSLIGAAFMLIAVLVYQLPRISFLLTRRHFSGQPKDGIEILDSDWKTFRKWIDA